MLQFSLELPEPRLSGLLKERLSTVCAEYDKSELLSVSCERRESALAYCCGDG